MSEQERFFVMNAVIYVFFNNQISSKFPIDKFQETSEWQDFCQFLNDKKTDEIEKKMRNFFKI